MDQRVQLVMNQMNDDLRQGRLTLRMSQSVNLSTSRFYYLFKAETGTSPARYLRTIRMQHAKDLLETTFLSVKEIIHQVGITDASHFVRDFKSIYGATPVKHRKWNFRGDSQSEQPLESGPINRKNG